MVTIYVQDLSSSSTVTIDERDTNQKKMTSKKKINKNLVEETNVFVAFSPLQT